MGFTKLDEGILQSSIMAEDSDTFKIWITLLAACKENGVAYVSPVFISSICRMDLDVVSRSLQKLEDPDPFSRSLEEDGRRVRRVDGGFEIINYHVYRTRSLKAAEAERKRLYRTKSKREEEEEAEAEESGQTRTPSGSVRTNPDANPKSFIQFNFNDGKWEGIEPADVSEWGAAFPAVNVREEVAKAGLWLKANPEKKKKNYRRFLFNWLSRAQERGGSYAGRRPPDKVGLNEPAKPMSEKEISGWKATVEKELRASARFKQILEAGPEKAEAWLKEALAAWEKETRSKRS